MPNMKNAKKAVKVINKRQVANNEYTAGMKNAIKKVDKAVISLDKEKALDALKVAVKKIDKAASKGVAKKNNAARNKARLTKKVKEMN
jgi:small subunit ribosomal protein S20